MLSGKFYKTKQGRLVEYINSCNGDVIAQARIPINAPKREFYYIDLNCGEYEFHFISTHNLKKYITDFDHGNIAYEIQKQEKQVGYICSKRRGGWIKGFLFDELSFNEVLYYVYFVELGKQGKRLLFYKIDNKSEKQVAEIWKSNEVINRLDEYFYQVMDKEYFLPVGIFLLFFDFRKNACYYGEKVFNCKEVIISTTKDKRLLDKYNPDFWQTNI